LVLEITAHIAGKSLKQDNPLRGLFQR